MAYGFAGQSRHLRVPCRQEKSRQIVLILPLDNAPQTSSTVLDVFAVLSLPRLDSGALRCCSGNIPRKRGRWRPQGVFRSKISEYISIVDSLR